MEQFCIVQALQSACSGNLHLCRFNDNVVSIYNELENNDYIHLKEKVEEYFDRLGNDCIYDKENK